MTNRFLLGAALSAMVMSAPVAPAAAQTRAISQSDRQQGAAANPQLLQQFGGAYSGPQAAYVERVGKRVAVQSGLSNAQGDFTVTLLDSPVENAFAIPGGYVYVTRQLLALMNSEAELAAVLGHEVGHVAARHSNSRNNRSTLGSLGAAIVGAVTGSDLVTRGLGVASQLYTLSYSRSQEYQADQLGVRYSTGAGYNAYGMADLLDQLNAAQALSAQVDGRQGNATPTWMSTHPNGAERVRRAAALARQGGAAQPTAQDVTFLRSLEGLRYDDNPAQGVIEGSTFRHPQLRVRFTAPQGYQMSNGTSAVTVAGTGGQAQFLSGAATSDVGSFVRQRLASLGAGVSAATPQAGRVNGIETAQATIRGTANGQAVDVTVVAYRYPAATYYFQLATPVGRGIGPFASMVQSVAPLSDQEATAIVGRRVRIVTVRAGDTVDSLSRQMAYADFQRERFLTLNALDANAALAPGTLVKVIVRG